MARILISGSHGMIGRTVMEARQASGDTVIRLLRAGSREKGIIRQANDALAPELLSGFDAVIHLAGEPVAGRWTSARKDRIRGSRVEGTATLARALAAASSPPRVFVSASGINYYGDTGTSLADESTRKGSGFLADICQQWEAAAQPLDAVCRVVHLRIGVVLSKEGGALASMLPLFRLGLGGPVAGGHCYLSWISLLDLRRAIDHVVASERLSGPLNLVAPQPVTGGEFTSALAAALRRPAVLPVPAWLARLALGEIADETVLSSIRAVPRKLLDDGFTFLDGTVQEALARWRSSPV